MRILLKIKKAQKYLCTVIEYVFMFGHPCRGLEPKGLLLLSPSLTGCPTPSVWGYQGSELPVTLVFPKGVFVGAEW